MADTKISALTECTTAASTDSLAIVTLLSSSAETERVTVATIASAVYEINQASIILEYQVFS